MSTERAVRGSGMPLGSAQVRGLRLGAVFVGALVLGLLVSFSAQRWQGRGRVLPGVTCAGVSLAGLGDQQIERALRPLAQRLKRLEIHLQLRDQTKIAAASALGAALDVDRMKARALGQGRTGSVFHQLSFFLQRLGSSVEVDAVLALDRDVLEASIEPWSKQILASPRLPSLSYQNGLRLEQGQAGEVVDFKTLESDLRTRISTALGAPGRAPDPSPIQLRSEHRALVIDAAIVAERMRQAEELIAAPILVKTADGEHQIKIRPATLGGALGSRIDEAERRFELTLSIEQLRPRLKSWLADIEVAPRDAEFVFGPGSAKTIEPSVDGHVLDEDAFISALWAAAADQERTAVLPLKRIEPKLTTELAESLHIKKLVSQFVTHHPCCQPRVHNIHTAAARLDGTILRPSERFSLNDLLGPRGPASGYKSAPTIVRGDMRDMYGGGISQLATTLFNAVLRGGYKIIQRQPHSVYFSRYPEGHEATVSFPLPDLIFENDTKSGMLIRTQYTPTFIKVLIYGDDEGRVVTVDKSRRYDIKKPPIEYEPNDSMDPEKPKRLRAGQLGWTVLVSRRIKYGDGRVEQEKREVVYNPRSELMRVHPCTIPEGEPGHTGEDCPEPEELDEHEEELSEDKYYETVFYDEEEG